MNKIQKFVVLFALFIVPLLFYIFLSSGINNFARLPILSKNVVDISEIDNTQNFKQNITVLTFLGDDLSNVKGGFFNLNQKIYKPFYDFKDFQFIALVPKGKEIEVALFKKELGAFTDMQKWNFVFASKEEINALYESLAVQKPLNENGYTPNAFIIDKEGNLRGRTDDKDNENGKLFGYNMQSVAELNNKMKDDVKVVLAEYRLALKKNNADREI